MMDYIIRFIFERILEPTGREQRLLKDVNAGLKGLAISSRGYATRWIDLEKLPASSGNSLVTRLTGKLALETVHNFVEIMRPELARWSRFS